MIGFGAGVGQMSSIFGLQTCCNELLGGESELASGGTERLLFAHRAVRPSSISLA